MFSDAEVFSTGDQTLDRSLGRALVRISQYFNVRPAFGFYNDMNAQASEQSSPNIPNTWGTVLFGTPLFREEMTNRDRTGLTVVAIVAHEFGHIVQYQKGIPQRVLPGQPTVKRLELHADILSGYYLGNLKKNNPTLSVYSAGEVFHRIGDYNFTSKNHHGTPDERAKASNLGFTHGQAGNTNLNQMIEIGIQYVMNL